MSVVCVIRKEQQTAKIRCGIVHQIDIAQADCTLSDNCSVASQVQIHIIAFLEQMYNAVLPAQNNLESLVRYRLGWYYLNHLLFHQSFISFAIERDFVALPSLLLDVPVVEVIPVSTVLASLGFVASSSAMGGGSSDTSVQIFFYYFLLNLIFHYFYHL